MRIKHLIFVSVVVALAASACSSTSATTTTSAPNISDPTSAPSTTVVSTPQPTAPSDYAGYLQQPTACGATQPAPVVDMTFDEPGDAVVTDATSVILATSCGQIEILLDNEGAPEAVNSFVFLAQSGYFDGTVSHRIIPGFMMQAGDPTATGLGGPGYSIPDEYPNEADYRRGVVAMANAGPGTTGSQFFILFGDAPWLPATFSIIGEVTEGFDTMDSIEALLLGANPRSADPTPSTPLESLFIESVTVSG